MEADPTPHEKSRIKQHLEEILVEKGEVVHKGIGKTAICLEVLKRLIEEDARYDQITKDRQTRRQPKWGAIYKAVTNIARRNGGINAKITEALKRKEAVAEDDHEESLEVLTSEESSEEGDVVHKGPLSPKAAAVDTAQIYSEKAKQLASMASLPPTKEAAV